jgi:hypothetical protein
MRRWVLSHSHPWGTHWELRNPLGTWREHWGNKGKMKKILPHPLHPKLKRNKILKHTHALRLSVCLSVRPISYWLEDLFNVRLDGRAEGRWVLSHSHPWGTHWELRNPLGTWREHRRNKGKMKKILPPPPPPVEGRNLGKGGRGGLRNGGCGNSRILKTPVKIGHLLGV